MSAPANVGLMPAPECTCRIICRSYGSEITFCPLHAAAGDLYAALEALPLDAFDKDMDTIDAAEFVDNAGAFFEAMQKARAARAKANPHRQEVDDASNRA